MKARLPVAISSVSYFAFTPLAASTVRELRSISVTRAPACRVMPFSVYHGSGFMKISLGSWMPLRMLDSRIRL